MSYKGIYFLHDGEVITMDKKMELAIKVRNYLNAYTGWNFEAQKIDGLWVVHTVLNHKKGTDISICYILEQDSAQLRVAIRDCKCTVEHLKETVRAKKVNFLIGVMELNGWAAALVTRMALDALEQEVHIIAGEIMTAMVEIVTDVVNETV